MERGILIVLLLLLSATSLYQSWYIRKIGKQLRESGNLMASAAARLKVLAESSKEKLKHVEHEDTEA